MCERKCPNELACILPFYPPPVTKPVLAHDIEQVIVWRVHSERVGVLMTLQTRAAASHSFLLVCILLSALSLILQICPNT